MRILAGAAIPFSAAVFAAVYLAPAWALPWLAAGCAAAALAALLLKGERRTRVLLAALGLAAGLLWTWGYDSLVLAPALALDGTEGTDSFTLTDWPRATAYGISIPARLTLPGGGETQVILYADEGIEGRPGDTVTCTAAFRRANLRLGEESEYHLSKGVTLFAYVKGSPQVSALPAIPLRYWPLAAARAVRERVAALFPPDTAGFMSALLTGDMATLDGGLYSAFQRTGLAHVVAVSGQHVSFLAGLLAFLMGRRRKVSAAVTIGVLLFFAAATGGTPSVLRAVYLQSALLLAPLLGREDDKATSLSAVLMLLLMWNPHAAASGNLQLSFAAVAGIYLVTGPLYERWTGALGERRPRRLLRFLCGNLAASIGALVFTTPLLAWYFGAVSLVAPLANLLTLWAVTYAFLGGLAAVAAGFLLPGAGQVLGWATAWLVRYVQWVAGALARLPFAAVPARGYLSLWLGFAYVLLVLWVLWRGERKRPAVPICACVLTLCAALVLNVLTLRGGGLRVSALDVGQGSCTLLCSGGRTALVDCGGTNPAGSGDAAANAIQATGSGRLDYLILTHFHADHAGGVERLMQRLEVGTLIVPDAQPDDLLRARILALAEAGGTEVRFLLSDSQITLGEASLTLYAPLGDGGANEEGLSVLATCGEFDALMTGDMNAAVEKRLVKYGNLPDIELLVVGHHGSAHSSSEELLLAARPEYAVISVGYNNYGHPAPEALERLAAAGCAIYRTDLMGTVSITANREDHEWHMAARRRTTAPIKS